MKKQTISGATTQHMTIEGVPVRDILGSPAFIELARQWKDRGISMHYVASKGVLVASVWYSGNRFAVSVNAIGEVHPVQLADDVNLKLLRLLSAGCRI